MLKQNFTLTDWPVIGHDAVTTYLRQTIASHTPISALVLSGREHSGKSSVAYYYAASLICVNLDHRPCGECYHCRQLAAGTHADVRWITPDIEAAQPTINIEQVRELREQLQLRSFSNSHKVAIITDAHCMTLAAANGLLKTLEEPTPDTTLILTTTHTDRLLPTILSRCQRLELLPVATHTIVESLVNRGVDRKKAVGYAHVANGKPGLALRYAADAQTYLEAQERYQEALAILAQTSLAEKFGLIRKRLGNNASQAGLELLSEVMVVVRDLTLMRFSLHALLHNPAAAPRLSEVATRYSNNQLTSLLAGCHRALIDIRSQVNPALVLEDLFLNV